MNPRSWQWLSSGLLAVLVAGSQMPPAKAQLSFEYDCPLDYQVYDLKDRTVNLRRSPNGAVVQAVPNGTQVADTYPDVPPYPDTAEWFSVRYQNRVVYVSKKLLYPTVYTAMDPSDRRVNLRNSPNGVILRSIPNGTNVRLVAPQAGWFKVRLRNGQVGYISAKLLKPAQCF
ncbi:MAG TPA: SH3 domain-containing protein [Leptolyngbyaceae cyanobacterium M33_DOE_097]|nr:SH3 domain-containing protein [Leptolyngbyaceae cyanobacterium M33_DOE_097]